MIDFGNDICSSDDNNRLIHKKEENKEEKTAEGRLITSKYV